MAPTPSVLLQVCLMAAALTTSGCTGQRPADSRPAAVTSAPPVITSLNPSSGPAGRAYPIQLTIRGMRFHETGNVVVFGALTIPDLASTHGGTQIVVAVPKVTPSTGEVPPFVLLPADYSVTVTTPDGTSAPMTFTLVRPQEPGGGGR